MINEVRLIGNVGGDPEIKKGSNYTMAKFGVATTSGYKDKKGEWQEQTQWHNVVVFGFGADHVEKFVQRGTLVYVEGSIEYQKYEKNGEDRYYTQIKANRVRALNKKKDNGGGYGEPDKYDYAPPPHSTGDDVPF